jgi:hypothetical protein
VNASASISVPIGPTIVEYANTQDGGTYVCDYLESSLFGCVAAGCLCAAGSAKATDYNAAAQFSSTNNPGSVWNYYYSNTLLMTDYMQSISGISGYNGWWNGEGLPNSARVGADHTGKDFWEDGGTGSSILHTTDALNLDPEGLSAQVQFTAPASGTYRISGSFTGYDKYIYGSVPTHPVAILDDGRQIWSSQIDSFGQPDTFGLSEYLASGDTITFSVGTGTDTGCTFCYLSTGLVADISTPESSTPEPSTWAAMLVGFAVLGYSGLRLRRKNSASISAASLGAARAHEHEP